MFVFMLEFDAVFVDLYVRYIIFKGIKTFQFLVYHKYGPKYKYINIST